jgi:hypothetical protein
MLPIVFKFTKGQTVKLYAGHEDQGQRLRIKMSKIFVKFQYLHWFLTYNVKQELNKLLAQP